MKKGRLKLVLGLAIGCLVAVALVGCGSDDKEEPQTSNGSTTSETQVIRVGATPAPHADVLAEIKDVLAEDGYELEVVEYSDYVQPNVALSQGDLDANYFQHITYLEEYNEEKGTDLVSAAGIHFEPLCIYPGKTTNLDDLPDGAQIAVPNDTTNEARALLLLEDLGYITLEEGAGLTATKNQIVDNPKNLDIVEAEAATLPRILEDVDLAVINGNYAISAGLDAKTSLAGEENTSEAADKYVNVVAVQPSEQNSEKTQALVKALQSEKVKTFIEATYEGAVIPLF